MQRPVFEPNSLWWVVLAMLGGYISIVLSAAIPLGFLSVTWQINLFQVVVGNGIFPLLALVLARLITIINPGRYQIRLLQRLRITALIASAVFLVLIPLYWIAFTTDLTARLAQPVRQIAQTREAISKVRTAARASSSYSEFKRNIKEQGLEVNGDGGVSSRTDDALPFSQRRQQILDNMDRSEASLPTIPSVRLGMPLPSILQGILRICLPSLLLSVGFAALSGCELFSRQLRWLSRSKVPHASSISYFDEISK